MDLETVEFASGEVVDDLLILDEAGHSSTKGREKLLDLVGIAFDDGFDAAVRQVLDHARNRELLGNRHRRHAESNALDTTGKKDVATQHGHKSLPDEESNEPDDLQTPA